MSPSATAAATPGRGELLVAVMAAGLNRADLLAFGRSPGSAPGRELAGEVLAVGEGVEGFSVGDRVMARGAGFSHEAVVEARTSFLVPASMSYEEAGALPVAISTMHDAIVTHGRIEAGGRVLVHAATSGVGVTGVQIAAAMGASTIFVTSRSADKLRVLGEHLGALPCDVVAIDTSTERFEQVASDVDVIVDNVGASVLEGNIEAAAITGRIVQVGRLGGRHGSVDLDELARKRIELIGVTFRTRSDDEVAEVFRCVEQDLGHRLADFRPRVAATFPLSDIESAFAELAENRHVGKIIVVP